MTSQTLVLDEILKFTFYHPHCVRRVEEDTLILDNPPEQEVELEACISLIVIIIIISRSLLNDPSAGEQEEELDSCFSPNSEESTAMSNQLLKCADLLHAIKVEKVLI